jgi:hypothetical protein
MLSILTYTHANSNKVRRKFWEVMDSLGLDGSDAFMGVFLCPNAL